jgi:hypothetical protein
MGMLKVISPCRMPIKKIQRAVPAPFTSMLRAKAGLAINVITIPIIATFRDPLIPFMLFSSF